MTILAALALALLLAAPATVHADGAVNGIVSASEPAGTALPGAFVALTGPNGQYAATTDATGAFTLADVATGDYTLVAQASGHAVGQSNVTVAASDVTQDLALTPSGAVFDALGVYGGQIASLVADGQSGVFYASTSVIPQVFRTVDFGGTWSPVTMAVDDATNGLVGTNVGGGLTTSGFPGEVAVEVSGTVYFSTDFGATWRGVTNPPGPGTGGGPGTLLLWGHAGTTNVLLKVSNGTTVRADMSVASPAFAAQTPSYTASPDDRVTVANGTDGAYVAVVSAAGALTVFDLAENPPATPITTHAGLPAPPTFVRFGGAQAAGVPPDALFVYANTGGTAVMATKSGGTSFTSVSASSTVPGGCGQGPGSVGAITPQSTGANGNATLSQCFVTKSGTGTLTFATINGINNNTGLAFDAGYDRATNFVVLSGDGNRGIVKSAQESGGLPSFPSGATASAGSGALTGGIAVNGFTVPVVKDTSYGPAGASQLATVLSGSGGGLSVASEDGGATFTTVVAKGGNAVDWWQGSADSWLVFGHGGAGDLLSAVGGWSASAPPLPGPNVTGTGAATLGAGGMPEQWSITAIRGVAGDDVVFVGGGANIDQNGDAGAVYRATLAGSGAAVTASGGTVVSGALVSRAVRALAHCASIGTDTDVLFVATADNATGSIVRIVGATGGSPTETEVLTGVRVNDVRAHCASGTVYAGTGSNMGGPSGGLQASTDGGLTFATVPLTAPGIPPNLNVQVVAVDPSDAAHVLIAGNSEGFILESTDGGTTWTVANSPTAPGGRNFLSEGVGDLELPPVTSALGRAADTASTLVGTGGGLFAARFGGTGGGGGGGGACTSVAECDDDNACTTDACTANTCTSTTLPGAEGVRCELDAADALLACADTKLARQARKKLAKVAKLLDKHAAATKAPKAAKLLKAIGAQLAALEKKVGKAKKTDAECQATIAAQLDAIAALVADLGGSSS